MGCGSLLVRKSLEIRTVSILVSSYAGKCHAHNDQLSFHPSQPSVRTRVARQAWGPLEAVVGEGEGR